MTKNTITIGKYQIDSWEDRGFLVQLINNNAIRNKIVKYYKYKTQEQATEYIQSTIKSIKANLEHKAKRKADRQRFVNPAKVGNILKASWGYDQTNIDYYQVVKVMNKSVVIREINQKFLSNDGYGSDKVTAKANSWKGKPMTKRVRGDIKHPDTYRVSIASYSLAYLWNGTPDRQTDAYHGH